MANIFTSKCVNGLWGVSNTEDGAFAELGFQSGARLDAERISSELNEGLYRAGRLQWIVTETTHEYAQQPASRRIKPQLRSASEIPVPPGS